MVFDGSDAPDLSDGWDGIRRAAFRPSTRRMRTIAKADIVAHGICAAGMALCVVALALSFGRPAWGLLAVPALAVYAAASLKRPFRRLRLARREFPAAWREVLLREVRFYRGLDGAGRARFERDLRWSLDERTVEGVDGVRVTDELRVLIAAGAAVILHGQPEWELPRGHAVLVYPGSFDEEFRCAPRGPFDGQAHGQGPVIMARDAVRAGWRNPSDAGNVVLHEFAHLMDMKSGGPNGVPRMLARAAVGEWLDMVRAEMEKAARGRSLLRPYAAENEAEFFAVAVEYFFGQTRALRARHPRLYGALARFFNQEPA